MNVLKLSALALAVCATLALAGGAQAQPPLGRGPGFGPGPGVPPPMGPLARLLPPPERWSELGLTDEQQERIEALHDDEARATVRAEADARLAELDLARLLEQDTGDAAALDAAVAKVAAARADLLRAHVAMIRGARRVLTAEQRKKLARLGPPARGPRGDDGPGDGPPADRGGLRPRHE